MIYLIGGPPKCGKTTLSKLISREFHIPWVSADTLQCIAMIYIDEKDFDRKFPTKSQGGEGNDDKYRDFSSSEIISAYIEQGRTSYGAIDVFALSEMTEGNEYTIEGYQVTPEVAHDIVRKYGEDKVRAVFLVQKNIDTLVRNFEKSTTPNDWVLTGTMDREAVFPKIARMISQYSEYFEAEAKKYGFGAFEIGTNFEKKLMEIVSFLGISKSP